MKRVAIMILLSATLAMPLVATAQQPEFCRPGAPGHTQTTVYPEKDPTDTSGQRPFPVESPTGKLYIEMRMTPNQGTTIELYQESNHIAGLQRGGTARYGDGQEDDRCVDDRDHAPDTLLI